MTMCVAMQGSVKKKQTVAHAKQSTPVSNKMPPKQKLFFFFFFLLEIFCRAQRRLLLVCKHRFVCLF